MTENIKAGIARILALYEGERQRADEMSAKLALAQAEVAGLKSKVEELTRETENLKLAGAFVAGENNSDAKDRITRLIAEIDRCIALLEK